jgi:hypothetical protein
VIICAALKIQVEGLDHDTTIPCWRHGNGFQILEDLGFYPKKGYKVLEQGFINHKGEFLNRKEAFNHVKEIGQCNATQRWYWQDHAQDELYSEDLY